MKRVRCKIGRPAIGSAVTLLILLFGALPARSQAPGWQRALRIALAVRTLDGMYRPFPEQVRHFFSERSMADGGAPEWARQASPVHLKAPYEVDARRFRFFADVS